MSNFICKKAFIKNINILGNVIRYLTEINGIEIIVGLLNRGENKIYTVGSEVELMFLKKELKNLK